MRRTLLAFFLLGCSALANAQYSPQNPPPVSFIFAGPTAVPAQGGGMEVQFKYTLAIHSLEPDRIEIVDSGTGHVLMTDDRPSLKETTFKIPTNPSLKIFQWEGRTANEAITESTPAWLYEKPDTRVSLEARLFKRGELVFRWPQTAVYAYGSKLSILQALEHNKKIDAVARKLPQ